MHRHVLSKTVSKPCGNAISCPLMCFCLFLIHNLHFRHIPLVYKEIRMYAIITRHLHHTFEPYATHRLQQFVDCGDFSKTVQMLQTENASAYIRYTFIIRWLIVECRQCRHSTQTSVYICATMLSTQIPFRHSSGSSCSFGIFSFLWVKKFYLLAGMFFSLCLLQKLFFSNFYCCPTLCELDKMKSSAIPSVKIRLAFRIFVFHLSDWRFSFSLYP